MVLRDLSPALSSPGFLPRLWVCCQENSEDEASERPEADGDCGVLASPHLRPQKGPRLMVHTAQQVLFVLETGSPGASAGELPSTGVPAHHPGTWVQITLFLSVWVK